MKAAHSKRDEWLCSITLSITLSIYKLRFDSVTRNLTALPLLADQAVWKINEQMPNCRNHYCSFSSPRHSYQQGGRGLQCMCFYLSVPSRIFPSKNPPAAPNPPIERERKERVMFSSPCLTDLAYETKNLFINVYFHQFHSCHL